MKKAVLKQLIFALVVALFLSACNQINNSDAYEKDTTAKKISKSTYTPVTIWIEDFANLREAIYRQDIAKMKAYFNFPVFVDTTQIWQAIYDNMDQSERPHTTPSTFTGEDLEKNYSRLFNEDFVKSLLKVNTGPLYKDGEFTTPKTVNKDRSFYMLAQYDKATKSIQLSLIYSGWKDENGVDMSEGESATIYFFKVTNTNHLIFEKILFAG
ncbi:hypothetical protein [Pedobacter agri]|uniref:hypothetical protein n=1 Tax=Pedobacter agri TaxID=454586 RepID=UPI00292EE4C0|nr:hypothetical protein [Pedobacter agri]